MTAILRERCRACGHALHGPVIDLGEQAQQGFFPTPGAALPVNGRHPLRLMRCTGRCGLLQLDRTLPAELLYDRYWYRSGVNATMRAHLHGLAEAALRRVRSPDPAVLDIGCNDGTLLSRCPPGGRRIGIDPSDVALADQSIELIRGHFPAATEHLETASLDLVTSIAMFYDLDDPVTAASAIGRLLRPDGIWVVELSYLPLMLETGALDTICHEHLGYYSLKALEYVADRAGLRVFRAEINACNGGSIRCFLCHPRSRHLDGAADAATLARLREAESRLRLDGDAPYTAFQARAEATRRDLTDFLSGIRTRGERVHVYGASTKGNTLLQWCGIDREIVDCAAERNPHKVGTVTPGTGIPIVAEAQSRALRPDWYLVLPWHFRSEFLAREEATIRAGTRMLFPLPRLEVVEAANLPAALAAASRAASGEDGEEKRIERREVDFDRYVEAVQERIG